MTFVVTIVLLALLALGAFVLVKSYSDGKFDWKLGLAAAAALGAAVWGFVEQLF